MSVRIRLLGGFEVAVDGVPVPAATPGRAATPPRWSSCSPSPTAAGCTASRSSTRSGRLAARRRRPAAAQGGPLRPPRARRRRRRRCVLRHDVVALLPDGDVGVDADEFRALRRGGRWPTGTAAAAAAALDAYGGPLLPDDLYEPWTERGPRRRCGSLRVDLLRLAGRWEELLAEDPADEQAHLALARAQRRPGRRARGAAPARADGAGAAPRARHRARAPRREAAARPAGAAGPPRPPPTGPVAEATPAVRPPGRRRPGAASASTRAEAGRGGTLLVTGPPGVGKSAVLDLAEALARRRGWRTGRGTASAVEGPWPYAPVLEALGDLCRQHPALLDGLDDIYRLEIERALSGRDVTWSGESGHQRLFVAAAELMRLAAAGHGLLLVVDDLHEADEASLRLLHYLSRCAVDEPVLLALAHRPPVSEPLQADGRQPGRARHRQPDRARRRCSRGGHPAPARGPVPGPRRRGTREHIWAVSGGPAVHRAGAGARSRAPTVHGGVLPALPPAGAADLRAGGAARLDVHHRRAARGRRAWTRTRPTSTSRRRSQRSGRRAGRGRLPVPARPGPRGAGATQLSPPPRPPPHGGRSPSSWPGSARRPAGWPTTSSPPGLPSRAVPYVLRAVETAGALGAYRDALALVDGVRDARRTPTSCPGCWPGAATC